MLRCVHICVGVWMWMGEESMGEVQGGDLTTVGRERKRHCHLILKKDLGSR